MFTLLIYASNSQLYLPFGVIDMSKFWGGVMAACLVLPMGAQAADHPIGQPIEANGMKIAVAYIQAVTMDPQDEMCGPVEADIHMTAQIHAEKGNPLGFGEGQWIPNLGVTFEISRRGSAFDVKGTLVPMVAQGGPHYGRNLKLDGPGRYHVTLRVTPPSNRGFYRQTVNEGVDEDWDQPITRDLDFVFIGSPGKKGGY